MTAPSLREAAQMALDALDKCFPHLPANEFERADYAAHVLRAALALPDAEPVAWRISYTGADGLEYRRLFGHNAIGDYRTIDPDATSTPLFAAQPALVEPAKRPENCGTSFCSCIECVMPVERKPLSTEVIREWWASENGLEDCDMAKLAEFTDVIRAVEEKHHIKGAA